MSKTSKRKNRNKRKPDLAEQVARKEARKLKARRRRGGGIWSGLGAVGMVGWAVVLPLLVALAFGAWLDYVWPGPFSFKLMMLVVGIVLGCFNAWRWISQERQDTERARNHD